MAIQNSGKLNQLGRLLPEGLLVDAAWLESKGYSRSLRSQYVTAGWLEQPVRGVYQRPRGTPGWEQVVISLQALMRYPVSLGGRSALELQGYAHYLSHSPQAIHLYTDKKLPGWVSKMPAGPGYVIHNRSRFLPAVELPVEATTVSSDGPETIVPSLPGGLKSTPWGPWKWPLVLSSPERAILELIDELPNHESFYQVDAIMEGLVNLRPNQLQALLEDTHSIKVKRLFFYFADRHRHQWLARVERDKISLGAGKRVLFNGGKLDRAYNITVPGDMHAI